MYTHIYTHVHTYMYNYMYIYIYRYTHVYIHIFFCYGLLGLLSRLAFEFSSVPPNNHAQKSGPILVPYVDTCIRRHLSMKPGSISCSESIVLCNKWIAKLSPKARLSAGGYSFRAVVAQCPSAVWPIAEVFGRSGRRRWR